MAIKAKYLDNARMRTGKVQLGFVHVFKPQISKEGKEQYNCTILIDKDDTDTLNVVKKCIETAKERGVSELWGGKLPKKYIDPLHDGEEKEDTYEGFEGMMFLNVKSNRRPKVVDKNIEPILDEEELYSGCYALVTLSFWPYKNESQGVSVSLDNIMKIADGPRLGGGAASVESDFEGVDFDDDDDDL